MNLAAALLVAYWSGGAGPCPACGAALDAWAGAMAAALGSIGLGDAPPGGVRVGLTRHASVEARLQAAPGGVGWGGAAAWALTGGASPAPGLAGVGAVDLLGAVGRGPQGEGVAVGLRLHLVRESLLAPGLAVGALGRWVRAQTPAGRGAVADVAWRLDVQRSWGGWAVAAGAEWGAGHGRWRALDSLATSSRPRGRAAALAVLAPPWRFVRPWGQAGVRQLRVADRRAVAAWLGLGLRLAL